MLQEFKLGPTRTQFMGKVPYDVHRKVLQVSAAHMPGSRSHHGWIKWAVG